MRRHTLLFVVIFGAACQDKVPEPESLKPVPVSAPSIAAAASPITAASAPATPAAGLKKEELAAILSTVLAGGVTWN